MDTVRVFLPVPDAASWSATAFESVQRHSTAHLIAILDNAKPRADYVLGALADQLERNGQPTRAWRKFTPSMPASDDTVDAIVGAADLCVTALAD